MRIGLCDSEIGVPGLGDAPIQAHGGVIDLVVRSLEEKGDVTTDPINLDSLVDLYNFIGLPKSKP